MNRAEQRIAELERELAQAKAERRKEIYEQISQLERENKELLAKVEQFEVQCTALRAELTELKECS